MSPGNVALSDSRRVGIIQSQTNLTPTKLCPVDWFLKVTSPYRAAVSAVRDTVCR